MKKLLVGLLIFSGSMAYGQIDKCLSPAAIEYQESLTPGFADHVNDVFENAKQMGPWSEHKSAGVHTIPVVVHIVYNLPEQNLPDSVIYNQIATLNQDYNRMNPDTVNMRSDFDIVKGNPEIQFVLASLDPSGNPTSGITRTQTATQSFGSLTVATGDFSDLEAVKSTANGGIDPWDPNRYLNIWVCNMAVNFFGTEVVALLGYATPPAGLPNWPQGGPTANLIDGVVIQFQAFGSNNPNPLDPGTGPVTVKGRTPTHEVGHYLGLRHIWGDGDCTAEDGIDDTPNADAQSNQDCDATKNTCTDNIQGVDLPDMIENYMDYSAETCQNTFTAGQVALMKGVLESERYDLAHNNPAAGLTDLPLVAVDVYPNPATNEVSVSTKEQLKEIELYSLEGRHVEAELNGATIDISTLSNGTYVLKVRTEEGIGQTKFVKY